MQITRRLYTGEHDQSAMIHLAHLCQADTLHFIDLPYRLSSWALDDAENASLWVDGDGQILAWAVMQTPFWAIDYVIQPVIENELHPQVLAWADQRARALKGTTYAHPVWFVNVFADQAERRHVLESAGFSDQAHAGEDAWSKVWMRRDGQVALPEYPPPQGFTLRSLAGESEVAAYVELHQAVFETKNMTIEWRLRTLHHPGYNASFDVVASSPDGKLAAFCIGWLMQASGGELIGQVEPLGCHADFRSYALGRVALRETLHRLQQAGAQSIYVETDSYRNTAFRLYESMGFQVLRQVLVYSKGYNDKES